MPDDVNQNTIQQYVADMVALEGHIEQAMDGQVGSFQSDPQVGQYFQLFHSTVRQHRDDLKQHLSMLGGSEASPIKEGVAALFGAAAGAIDKARTERISKALRDDFTAFHHAIIGYTMLHTTAIALGYQETAQIAEQYLRHYASFVQEIANLVPDVVVRELSDETRIVNEGAAERTRQAYHQVWQSSGGRRAAA